MSFCHHLGFSIFRFISYKNGRIYRTSQKQIASVGLTDEIIFGNLFAREIILRYLERFGDFNTYNERWVNNTASELKQEIFNGEYAPVLKKFKSEQVLMSHFEEHAKAYLYKLFRKHDAFVFDSVGRFEIYDGKFKISVPVVYTRYLNKLKSIDYFKLTLPDSVVLAHVVYPPDMILLLQFATKLKYKFVRVFNLSKNLHSTINLGWYKKIYYNKREFESLYDQYTELDPETFIKKSVEYDPNPWTYQCENCSMKYICHTYLYEAGKNIFKRTLFEEG